MFMLSDVPRVAFFTKGIDMNSSARNGLAAVGLMAALSGGAVHAAYLPPSFHDFGQAVGDGSYTRIIRITPETKAVGVYRLEKIKFADAETGRSFVWNFNTIHAGNFPLADIAPSDVLAGQAVQAYVWDVATTDSQP
jgi:hypothetical protein